jgi:carboxyl-terminal processing protease
MSAVITVNEFSHDVGRWRCSRSKLRAAAGKRITGVVLDLRGNPGGELDEAVALSDLFLTKGVVVSQRGRRRAKTPSIAPKRCSPAMPPRACR